MTYILVALMFLSGELQARVIPMDGRNGCEQAAVAVRANYPDATVNCVLVKGQPT